MKKIYTLCLSAFLGASAFAQTQPERILVHSKTGSKMGFLAERVDSITFPKLEGRVAADLKILDVQIDTITISITRTEQCQAFKLKNIPEVLANRLADDAALAEFINNDPEQPFYYQDFTAGKMTDPSLVPDSKYVLATVGYDGYGIPCSVSRASFKTPKRPLVGNPEVKTTVDEINARDFSLSFVPNQDVEGFAVVAGEAGTMQSQYEQWGPMFGFKNFGDLVKQWGIQGGKDEIGNTWKDMAPNTDYEVFVQAWDVNGTYADCDTIKVKTKTLGGNGVSGVNVKLGKYAMADWGEEGMKASQTITYTPNDQSSCYRFNVALKANYDQDPEGFKNDLRQDPPFPMSNWFYYEPLTTDYAIEPNTEFVVLTVAKNALNEWSEVKVENFTTPAQAEGQQVPASISRTAKISARNLKSNVYYVQPGTVPSFAKPAGLKLTGK